MPYMQPQNCPGQVLAMAYVPMQSFQALYEPCEALKNGTIFSELNKPFLGWKGGCRC
nr:spore coat associated protein CotJA [Roseburia sp. 1XD42-69]